MSYIKYLNSQFKRKLKSRAYTHGGIIGITAEEQEKIIKNDPRKGKYKKRFHKKNKRIFHKQITIGQKFKNDFRKKCIDEKLNELKKLSIVRFNNPISYIKRRERKHKSKEMCFVCIINRAYCQHHIILLVNGGYDSIDNCIPICNTCHAEIHKWLKKPTIEQYKEIQAMDLAFANTFYV